MDERPKSGQKISNRAGCKANSSLLAKTVTIQDLSNTCLSVQDTGDVVMRMQDRQHLSRINGQEICASGGRKPKSLLVIMVRVANVDKTP